MRGLKCVNIVKEYDDGSLKVKVLNKVNLVFNSSGLITIIGESGSGKSTLLNIIGGIDTPTSGHLLVNGKPSRHYCSFVSQNINLIEHLRIRKMLKIFDVDKDSLKRFDLAKTYNNFPNQLSQGQRQRLSILLAINSHTNIILADEPTSAQDEENAKNIILELKKISKKKLVIIATHDLDLANKYSDSIYKIENGLVHNLKEYTKNKDLIINNETIKISYKNFFPYILNSLKCNLTKSVLLVLCTVFAVLGPILTNNISKTLPKIIENQQKLSPISNKFYLQTCKNSTLSNVSYSNCKNPSTEEISAVPISNDYAVKDNLDYMLNLILNNQKILTFQDEVILKEGRPPKNFFEVIANENYFINQEIKMSSKYFFSYQTTHDVIDKEFVFKVVGIFQKEIFKKDENIYIDYEQASNFLKNYTLYNISKKMNLEKSIYSYFKDHNQDNHKYILFINNMNNINKILQGASFTLSEEINLIQLYSPSYNFYSFLHNVIKESYSMINYISISNLFTVAFFFAIISRMTIYQKKKEVGSLQLMNVKKSQINALLISENLLLSFFSYAATIIILLIFRRIINIIFKIYIINIELEGLFLLLFSIIIVNILLFLINLYYLNRAKIVDIMRDEI